MKTNQVLTRKMGQFDVHQRTCDGMFNATSLITQWNKDKGLARGKEVNDFLKIDKTKEFILEIQNRENHNTNKIVLSKKGKNGGTWLHPLVFIDFAMWLNASFKYDVLKFVYDELIKYRHDAGDNYKLLSESVAKIVDKSFLPVAIQNVAKGINYVVFNKHQNGIRNTEASEESLRELSNLEVKLSELINDNFIKSYNELMDYLRKQWVKKHEPKLLKSA
jgi:hypothetical protein